MADYRAELIQAFDNPTFQFVKPESSSVEVKIKNQWVLAQVTKHMMDVKGDHYIEFIANGNQYILPTGSNYLRAPQGV